jgi:hygromycin-B 7''-O-kinase
VEDIVRRIAARHRVPAGRVRPLPTGAANHVYLLGEQLVLRVARSAAGAADLRKEAAVIPVARDAGVRTPELVWFDGDAMVLARAPGSDLADRVRQPRVLAELGRQLALLHAVSVRPDGVPAHDAGPEPGVLTAAIARDGMIDRDTAGWLDGWVGRLTALVPADPRRTLLHGDIAPQNLIEHAGRLTGIVDWGDAGWADPAAEFAKMPLAEVPAVLAGYGVPGLEPAVLRYHLLWALGRLRDTTPRPGQRHWTAPPAARLLDLLRFFAAGPPAPWSRLR